MDKLQSQLDAETLDFFNYILAKMFNVELQGYVYSEEDWKQGRIYFLPLFFANTDNAFHKCHFALLQINPIPKFLYVE